jgi:hypothetical protein
MTSDRRNFLLGAPASLCGLAQLESILRAQPSVPSTAAARKVVDFWMNGMGVDPSQLLGGKSRGPRPAGPTVGNYGREPLFLHYDPDDGRIRLAEEIEPGRLTASGNTSVQFQMQRLRLNPEDTNHFKNYASGAIYLDVAQQSQADQQKAQESSTVDMLMTFASSIFSAIFPNKSAAGKPTAGGKDSSTPAANKAKKFTDTSSASAATSSVQLQKGKQGQSISLPNGAGTTAFCCFAKDRRKSAFGNFISAIAQLGGDSSIPSYLQLLSIPGIAVSALSAVRALVANFQLQGGDQEPIIWSPPLDIATTRQALSQTPTAIRFKSGDYIAIPKEHASELKDQIPKLKILDGFLVPKEATAFDVYDAYANTVPRVSYFSLNVKVKPIGPG